MWFWAECKRESLGLLAEEAYGKFDRILRDLVYTINGKKYGARKGQLTDYSSTPGIYDLFVKPRRVRLAGANHDPTYQLAEDFEGNRISRWTADMVWYVVARHGDYCANVPQALLGWAGLRLGGWWVWHKYRYRDYIAGRPMKYNRFALKIYRLVSWCKRGKEQY